MDDDTSENTDCDDTDDNAVTIVIRIHNKSWGFESKIWIGAE